MEKDQSILHEYKEYHYLLDDVSWKENLPDFTFYRSESTSPNPKVSVIIANYNNEPYLKRMMDSLVQQTIGIENLQVLFIDDCSTDQSIDVILAYVEKCPSIEVYQLNSNTGGAHGPRNVGILNARGAYAVFLDSDDWYDLNALNYLSELLDESGDDVSVSGLDQIKDDNLLIKR